MTTIVLAGVFFSVLVKGYFWALRNIPDSNPEREYVLDANPLLPQQPHIVYRQSQTSGEPK